MKVALIFHFFHVFKVCSLAFFTNFQSEVYLAEMYKAHSNCKNGTTGVIFKKSTIHLEERSNFCNAILPLQYQLYSLLPDTDLTLDSMC